MDFLKPKYKPYNRDIKRKSFNEYKKSIKLIGKGVKEIESNFIKALFLNNGATYVEIFKFYNKMFIEYNKKTNKKLKYNYINPLLFVEKYYPLENE